MNAEENNTQLPQSSVTPCFCFLCGTKLEEVGLGWLQCSSEKCGEVFLPFKDTEGNQNLMMQYTPFSLK